MKIVVSGASGFVGAEIAAQLSSAGHSVLRIGRRSECELRSDFKRAETVGAVDFSGADALIHCAGVVDEDFSTEPEAAFRHATLGTMALGMRAAACGVPRVVSISTAHIYGPFTGPVSEETAPDPRSDYAIAHFAAEQILKRIALQGGFAGATLRPCAIFGIPRAPTTFDRWHLIPFAFPLAAMRQRQISLKTTGLQQRNFVDIADVAHCVHHLLSEPVALGWRVVNPVGPDTLSVLEFAELCAAILERDHGHRCLIQRAGDGRSSSIVPFEFATTQSFSRGGGRVSAYVADFMERVSKGEITV